MIDQDLAHRPRSEGEEVLAVGVVVRLPGEELEPELADEGGRLERMGDVLPHHGTPPKPPQFASEKLEQRLLFRLLAVRCETQNPGRLSAATSSFVVRHGPTIGAPRRGAPAAPTRQRHARGTGGTPDSCRIADEQEGARDPVASAG